MIATPKVLLTHRLPKPGIDLLRRSVAQEIYSEDKIMPRSRFVEMIKDKEGLVCLLTDKIDKEIMKQVPQLKVIS